MIRQYEHLIHWCLLSLFVARPSVEHLFLRLLSFATGCALRVVGCNVQNIVVCKGPEGLYLLTLKILSSSPGPPSPFALTIVVAAQHQLKDKHGTRSRCRTRSRLNKKNRRQRYRLEKHNE